MISQRASVFPTTTPILFILMKCWPNSVKTMLALSQTCATSMASAMSTLTIATASLLENWIDEGEQRVWLSLRSCVTPTAEPTPTFRTASSRANIARLVGAGLTFAGCPTQAHQNAGGLSLGGNIRRSQ